MARRAYLDLFPIAGYLILAVIAYYPPPLVFRPQSLWKAR